MEYEDELANVVSELLGFRVNGFIDESLCDNNSTRIILRIPFSYGITFNLKQLCTKVYDLLNSSGLQPVSLQTDDVYIKVSKDQKDFLLNFIKLQRGGLFSDGIL